MHNAQGLSLIPLPTLTPRHIFTLLPHIRILLLLIGPFLSIMLPAGVVDSNVSKALEAFLNCPRVPCPLNEGGYTRRISSALSARTLETLCRRSYPPLQVIHIRVLLRKNRMHEANGLLREVRGNLGAIRFRFPENVVDDLLQQPP